MLTTPSRKRDLAPLPRGIQQQKYIAGIVYDLIAEFGIESVTMRQIAEAARVSLGTVTYHFGTKCVLIEAALKSGYELPSDWNSYRGSPAAQLRRIALLYVLRLPNDRWWRFWINHLAMSTRDAELRQHQSTRFEKQRAFWVRLFVAGQQSGEILPTLPVEETIDQMLAQVHGLVVLQMLKSNPAMRNAARATINRMIDSFLVAPP